MFVFGLCLIVVLVIGLVFFGIFAVRNEYLERKRRNRRREWYRKSYRKS